MTTSTTPCYQLTQSVYQPSDLLSMSSDPEVAQAAYQYSERHPECLHWDERCYLQEELSFFKSRDVLILDSRGETIAGIRHAMKVPIASIYRWMSLVFLPPDGWNLFELPLRRILDRASKAEIMPGNYLVVATSNSEIELRKLPPPYSFRARGISSARTPKDEMERIFALEILLRDRKDLIGGEMYEFADGDTDYEEGVGNRSGDTNKDHNNKIKDEDTMDVDSNPNGSISNCSGVGKNYKPELWSESDVNWARIYPVSRVVEWLEQLSLTERQNNSRVLEHLKSLNDACNGITLENDRHVKFAEYQLGIDVEDNLRVFDFFAGFDDADSDEQVEVYLMLEHIKDFNKRPSERLLADHFRMCLFRYFAGSVDLNLAATNFHSHAAYIGDFSMDLSEKCWYNGAGKEAVELYLERRLFASLVDSYEDNPDGSYKSRWPITRRERVEEFHTPAEGSSWPENFGITNIERTGKYREAVCLPSFDYIGMDEELPVTDPDIDEERVYIRVPFIIKRDGTLHTFPTLNSE